MPSHEGHETSRSSGINIKIGGTVPASPACVLLQHPCVQQASHATHATRAIVLRAQKRSVVFFGFLLYTAFCTLKS